MKGRRFDRRSALQGLLATTVGLTVGAPAVAEGARTYGTPWADASDFVDRIGVNTHLGQRGSVYDHHFESSIAPAIQDLGLTRIREGAYEVVPGVTDLFYRRIRDLARSGLRFSAVCYDPTNRYVTTQPRAIPRIYERYEGAVDTFEGGNEPDLAADPILNPTLSWLHQRELHDTIRRELSGNRLSVASPSYIQHNIALAKPLMGFTDLANLHSYPGMEHPETAGPGRLTSFRTALMPICGGVDSIITETGYHTAIATGGGHLPISEAIRARYTPRLLLFAHLSGMRRTFLYELRSSFDRGPADAESAFGLLTFDGRPTPTYQAVKRLIALFSRERTAAGGADIEGAPRQITIFGDQSDVVAAGFKRADGHHLLPIWLGVAGWDSDKRTARAALSRVLRLDCGSWRGAVSAHRFDDDGSVRVERQSGSDGMFDITISDRLTVLELAS